jgi:alpha-galactosidase
VYALREPGLELAVELALPEDRPLLLWRLRVRNVGQVSWRLHEIELAEIGSRFGRVADVGRRLTGRELRSHLTFHPRAGRLAIYINGYQSWSFSGGLMGGMGLPVTRLNYFDGPKLLNLRTPATGGLGHFTSDMFAAVGDVGHDVGLVLGFLSQREQFGHVEALLIDPRSPHLRLIAHGDDVPFGPGAERVTDWAALQVMRPSDPEALDPYLQAAAELNQARVPARAPVGWCSWYQYFDRVTEADIVSNLDAIRQTRDRLPLDFIQIDDGFQRQVGDWFETKPTFPRGLRWLAERIKAGGQTPGLWLAPYIVRSDAALVRQHPDWLLRERNGRRVSAGFNWWRWCYALDPSHPGVRDHLQALIHTTVHTWGYPYLKLDFLFAGALPGHRHDPSLTRAQAFRRGLEEIREAAGDDAFLLGCGSPLGPAIGIVDGMRIGTDVAPNWSPELISPLLSQWLNPELALFSARNAVQNTLTRAPLHRRWWLNDPDCLLVRDHDTQLTEAEVRSLATVIGLSGGMFLASDDMGRLRPQRARYLNSLLPILNVRPWVPNWLTEAMPDLFVSHLDRAPGEWWLLGVFNWEGYRRDREIDLAALGLPADQPLWVSEFWDQRIGRLEPGAPLRFESIPPHGARLVAVRVACSNTPNLVASSFHYSQGGEISRWAPEPRGLELVLSLGRHAEGELALALPEPVREAGAADGRTLPVRADGGLSRITLAVAGAETVRLSW